MWPERAREGGGRPSPQPGGWAVVYAGGHIHLPWTTSHFLYQSPGSARLGASVPRSPRRPGLQPQLRLDWGRVRLQDRDRARALGRIRLGLGGLRTSVSQPGPSAGSWHWASWSSSYYLLLLRQRETHTETHTLTQRQRMDPGEKEPGDATGFHEPPWKRHPSLYSLPQNRSHGPSTGEGRGCHEDTRGCVSERGHVSEIETPVRAVTPQSDASQDRAGPPVAQSQTGRCRRLDSHTTEGRASLTTQGQNGSQASGPNNAPKPVRSLGWRPDPSQSKGGGPTGAGIRDAWRPGEGLGQVKPREAALVAFRWANFCSGNQPPR